jgi:hypothetical protein
MRLIKVFEAPDGKVANLGDESHIVENVLGRVLQDGLVLDVLVVVLPPLEYASNPSEQQLR